MEIERKFTIKTLPENLEQFESKIIEQAYLNTNPVIRIRKQDEEYYLTYKGKGLLAREEYNLPLNKEAYYHLREKADGNIISKKRYLIPIVMPSFHEDSIYAAAKEKKIPSLTIELDLFDPPFSPLIIAEVEFSSEEMAEAFIAPAWFMDDVTYDSNYHNSTLSRIPFPEK